MTEAREIRPDTRNPTSATRRRLIAIAAAIGLERSLIARDAVVAQEEGEAMEPVITHINPEGMHQNPAFSQAVSVQGPAKTIYIGGQNAVDANGNIVGAGDLGAQTEQVLKNMQTVLAAAGAGPDDVIKWNVLVVQGQDINAGFAAFQRVWGPMAQPPLITFAFVAALAAPDFLVEIEAIAVTAAQPG